MKLMRNGKPAMAATRIVAADEELDTNDYDIEETIDDLADDVEDIQDTIDDVQSLWNLIRKWKRFPVPILFVIKKQTNI